MAALPPPPPPGTPPSPKPAPSLRPIRDVSIRHRANVAIGLVLVLAIAAAGVIVFLQLRDSGGGTAASFDRIVTIDRDGAVSILDADGQRVQDIDIDDASSLRQANGRYVVITGKDAVSILDAESGTVRAVDAEPGDRLRWFGTERPVLATSPPEGGDVRLTDAANGDAISFAKEARIDEPRLLADALVGDADADVFAISDLRRAPGRSIVVGFGRDTMTRPGAVVAAGGDGFAVVARSRQGPTSMTFFGLDGEERRFIADIADPVSRPLVDGDGLILLDERGRLYRASSQRNQVERAGSVDLRGDEIDAALPVGSDRMLVHTDGDVVVVVDASGVDQLRTRGSLEPVSIAARLQRDAELTGCVNVTTEVGVRQFDVDSGDELTRAPVEGRVASAHPDGCTVAMQAPAALLVRGAVVELAERESAGDVTADASAALVRSPGGLELRPIDGAEDEPLELGDVDGRLVTF